MVGVEGWSSNGGRQMVGVDVGAVHDASSGKSKVLYGQIRVLFPDF